jgi:excisionase family DNA binding protein
MDKQLVSKKQTADVLGCSVRTIENLIAQGQLKSIRLGKRRMIPYSEVMRIAKQGTDVITGTGR